VRRTRAAARPLVQVLADGITSDASADQGDPEE
jgi:hypothetical protein